MRVSIEKNNNDWLSQPANSSDFAIEFLSYCCGTVLCPVELILVMDSALEPL
jgi:hypothetical protein